MASSRDNYIRLVQRIGVTLSGADTRATRAVATVVTAFSARSYVTPYSCASARLQES